MNAHLIKITYRGATDSRESKVQMASQRFERDVVRIPYDHRYSNTFDIAEAWLKSHGYTIVCSGEMPNAYWAAVTEFKTLRESR